jgi:YggT family protein
MISFSLATVVHSVFRLCYLIVLIRCVLSFLRTPSYTSPWLPFWNFIYAVTEPLLKPIRRVLARYQAASRIDFSPLVLLLLLQLAEYLIIRALVA